MQLLRGCLGAIVVWCAVSAGHVAAQSDQNTCVLAGRVIDGDGRPIAGAVISVVNHACLRFPTLVPMRRSGPTGRDGSFEVTGLGVGRNVFACIKPGFHIDPAQMRSYDTTMVMFFDQGERRDDVVIHMLPVTPGERVDVLVTDEAGEPIAGADVEYADYLLGISDEQGRIISRHEAGLADVTLFRIAVRGTAAAISRDLRPKGDGVHITAAAGRTLHGRVVDAETGEAIEGALVWSLLIDDQNWSTTDAQGRFTIEHCQPADMTLVASAAACAGTAGIDARDNADREIVIRAQPTGTVQGTVADADTGKPVAGVWVSARMGVIYAARVLANADGRYCFTGVPTGDLTVTPGCAWANVTSWQGNRTAHVDPGQNLTAFDLKLDEPLLAFGTTQPRISGIVVDEDGAPVARAMVVVDEAEPADPSPTTRRPQQIETDIGGRFSTRAYVYNSRGQQLAIGVPYTVTVEHCSYVAAFVDGVVIPDDSKSKELRIVLRRGAALTGTVLDEKKQPVPNAWVWMWPKDEHDGSRWYEIRSGRTTRRALTDAAGRYTAHGLSPGEWLVLADHADYTPFAKPSEVRIGDDGSAAPLGFTLSASGKGTIEGTVVDSDGRPVPYVCIMAYGPGGRDLRSSTCTDADGHFLLGYLNDGAWNIMPNPSRGVRLLGVPTGTTDARITYPPDPAQGALRLTGVLVDEAGSPVTHFTVGDLLHEPSPNRKVVEYRTDTGRFTTATTARTLIICPDGYKAKRLIIDDAVEGPLDLRITMVKGSGLLDERIGADGTRTVTAGTSTSVRQRSRLVGSVPRAEEPCRWVNDGGPYGGRAYSVALYGADPNLVYAATEGGIYMSTDAAETWAYLGQPTNADGFPMQVRKLLVDPADSNMLYASSIRMFKSTDAGLTWKSIPGTEWRSLRAFTFGTGEANALYALPWDGPLMRTTDGGETWTSCLSDPAVSQVRHVLADPRAPGTVYALTEGKRAVFSSDDGATWRQSGGRLEGVSIEASEQSPDDPKRFKLTILFNDQSYTLEATSRAQEWTGSDKPPWIEPVAMHINPSDPRKLQLTFESQQNGEVLASPDEGKTWRALNVPCRPWRLEAIGVSATRDDLLYAGSKDGEYFFSADGGETWEFLYSRKDDPDGTDTATIEELNATFPCLFGSGRTLNEAPVVDPSNPQIAYATDRAAGITKTVDGGLTWRAMNHGIIAVAVYDIAADPKTRGVVYAAGTGGLYKSADSAKTWQRVRRGPTTCVVAVHPLTPRLVLAAGFSSGASMSSDAGETWRTISGIPGDRTVLAFFFDPRDAKRFCAVGYATMWATADAGRTWQVHAEWDAEDTGRLYTVWGAIAKSGASLIYRIEDETKLMRTTDLGKTWRTLDLPSAQAAISDGMTDPGDPKTVVVCTGHGGVFLSTDAGETWRSITTPCHPTFIELQPGDPNTFHLGSYDGDVLRTHDGGKTFERLGDPIPLSATSCLAISPADGAVYVGTHAFGVYRLESEQPPSTPEGDR